MEEIEFNCQQKGAMLCRNCGQNKYRIVSYTKCANIWECSNCGFTGAEKTKQLTMDQIDLL